MTQNMVRKASGDTENFSDEKLYHSLLRSGLSDKLAGQATSEIKKTLKKELSTDSIFNTTQNYLHEHLGDIYYLNYSLKRSVMRLGPSGYPFEELFSQILKAEGYTTKVGITLEGACVSHEVDVLAHKGDGQHFIECKFHNSPGLKTDVKVALYTKARFDDLQKTQSKEGVTNYSWLVTNTKITSDALDYLRCVGAKAIAWVYPKGEGLSDLIVRHGLHPVTSLSSITQPSLVRLFEHKIVTCSQLNTNLHLDSVNKIFTQEQLDQISQELKIICKHNE